MCAAVGTAHRLRDVAREARTLGRCYLKLSKYRLSGLVALTAGVGYTLRHEAGDDEAAHSFVRGAAVTTAGTWLAAACANTLNQLYERHSDGLMMRTRARPLPSGRVGVAHAVAFAAVAGATGLGLLAVETNPTATALAAANIALYAGVYTPLKRISTVNTPVGAIVGALPPLLGWAAASDGALTAPRERGGLALAATLFLWQIPHFHALAVVSRKDYAAASLRMLAVSDPVANALWARRAAAALVPAAFLFSATGVTAPVFAWQAAALGVWMHHGATKLVTSPASTAAARPLFRASIVHLPVVLALLCLHKTPYVYEAPAPAALPPPRAETTRIILQPWEVMAPFPFLPVPRGAPAVVYEVPESR